MRSDRAVDQSAGYKRQKYLKSGDLEINWQSYFYALVTLGL